MNMIYSRALASLLILGSFSANAEILFRDNFEYVVNRNQTGNASTTFSNQGGWTWAKTRQDTYGAGSNGYIYTTSTIPGYGGSFPGADSSRVLAMEFLPATLGGQTDAYLAIGGPSFPANKIPSNVWIQFWVYLQRQPGQMSRFGRGKFLYPSKTGNYPANPETGLDWLFIFKDSESYYPWFQDSTSPGNTIFMMESYGKANYGLGDAWQEHKLGPNVTRGQHDIRANTWTLIRIHYDTSGSSPLAPSGQGVWRMWKSTDGSNFTQVANWIGGVTPNFTWPIQNSQGGHRALKVGTTVDNYDSWFYLDDFVIASSEASLPRYSGIEDPMPLPPSNIQVE